MLVLVLIAMAIVLVACSPLGRESSNQNLTDASEALNELEVAEPGSMSGYSSESFEHWSRANDFG